MFSYLNNTTQQVWVTFLLIAWACLLFGGFLFGPSGKERRMPAWTRMASSAILVVAAISWALIGRDYGLQRYAFLLATGMLFGFVGDLSLAQIFTSGKAAKLGGILSFAVGHIFYIIAIWQLGNQIELTAAGTRLAALLVWWLVALIGWYLIVFRGSQAAQLHWIVLPYALLLSTTAGVAMGLALQSPAFWPLVAGAALFLVSDAFIAANWFRKAEFHLIHDVIWLTYGPAQMLIVYSAATAIQQLT